MVYELIQYPFYTAETVVCPCPRLTDIPDTCPVEKRDITDCSAKPILLTLYFSNILWHRRYFCSALCGVAIKIFYMPDGSNSSALFSSDDGMFGTSGSCVDSSMACTAILVSREIYWEMSADCPDEVATDTTRSSRST